MQLMDTIDNSINILGITHFVWESRIIKKFVFNKLSKDKMFCNPCIHRKAQKVYTMKNIWKKFWFTWVGGLYMWLFVKCDILLTILGYWCYWARHVIHCHGNGVLKYHMGHYKWPFNNIWKTLNDVKSGDNSIQWDIAWHYKMISYNLYNMMYYIFITW